jgi:hypothetical protein
MAEIGASPPNCNSPDTFARGDAAEAAGTVMTALTAFALDARIGDVDMPSFKRLLDDLEAVADWRDELAGKLRRAQLKLDLIGLDPDEQDYLAADVQTFTRLCSALGKSITRAI